MAPARIRTFYSYKGGVGRSMAVANVAILLAQKGRRVLVVDFDLDAPGMHRFFPEPERPGRPGVIDFFVELRTRLESAFPGPGDFNPTASNALATCRTHVEALLDREDFFQPVASAGNLKVMRAGRFDADYAELVRTFDWKKFFAEFGEIFGELREQLLARYDDILVDARTGLTDIGSISTVVLPDQLVIAFVPNEQALIGGLEVARQAFGLHAQHLHVKRTNQPLQIIPLLCRVDNTELDQRESWLQRAASSYAKLFHEIQVDRRADMLEFFKELHVPYFPYYAYGERIAASEEKARGLGSPIEAFGRLTDCLLHAGRFSEWLSHRRLETVADDRALLLQFDAGFELPQRWRFGDVVRIPDRSSGIDWRSLRRVPADAGAWQDAMGLIDRAIADATRDLHGNLHVFPMAPYPIAALLGRRLDDLARGVPIYVYQNDMTTHEWILFSPPRPTQEQEPFFRDMEELPTGGLGDDVVVAIEGFRQIHDDTLRAFGQAIGATSFVRLRQPREVPLDPGMEADRAVYDLRRAFARIQAARPAAGLHIVATCPMALLVEVGRMLSPNVYRRAIVYQYHPASASYAVGLDVVGQCLAGQGP